MKTKYVFIFEDGTFPPLDMSNCYIFDNLVDAASFFSKQNFMLRTYDDDSNFSIQHLQNRVTWCGDILQGTYN